MSVATATRDEIASCGRKQVVGGLVGERLMACGLEGLWQRRGGVWRSVGDSGCCDDGVGGSGVWRSGVG